MLICADGNSDGGVLICYYCNEYDGDCQLICVDGYDDGCVLTGMVVITTVWE